MSWTWDPDKNEANLGKHRLSFETAVLVFDDPLALSTPDPYPLEERWRTIGAVGSRFVVVVHSAPEEEGVRARQAGPNHLRTQGDAGRTEGI